MNFDFTKVLWGSNWRDQAGVVEAYVAEFGAAPTIPTLTTTAASSVTQTIATLNGNITATGGANATARGFAWGTSATMNGDTATTTENSSFSTGSYTSSLTSLTGGTTYYFRAYATNSAGTGYGSIQSFTTGADTTAPTPGNSGTVTTAGVGSASLTLNWTKATDNVSAQGALQYEVRQSASGNISTVSDAETNGAIIKAYTADINTFGVTGLSPGTTYYFAVIVKDEVGNKAVYTMKSQTTTTTAPSLTTSAASSVTQTAATLNGNITATGGANATARGFAWGTNANLSGGDTATTTENSSFSTGTYSAPLSSLTGGITYYFRAYATNSAGTGYGSILAMTASNNAAPTLTTGSASSITTTSATLAGSITSIGGVNATERGIVYGTSTNYSATSTDPGSYSTGSYSAGITSLTCNIQYHFAAYATNSVGTSYGSDNTFTTSACPGGGGGGGGGSGGSISSDPYKPLVTPSSAPATNPSGLSEGQVQSIITLLNSFGGIDQATINNVTAALRGTTPPLADSGLRSAGTASFTRNLQLHAIGADVRALQQYLNAHGFVIAESGAGSPGHETNLFGAATYAALVKFQAAHKLPATGYFGPLTRKVIASLLNNVTAALRGTTPPLADSGLRSAGTVSFTRNLQLHDTGPEVIALQQYLNTHGFLVAATGPGSPGHEVGVFGMATYNAVLRLQATYPSLPQSGYFGPLTRQVMGSSLH